LDNTIRSRQQLLGVVDSHLIVTVPYIWTRQEERRRRRKLILLLTAVVGSVVIAAAGCVYLGVSIDSSAWLDQLSVDRDTLRSWLDRLRSVSK
jgi:hypothetical protein